MKRRQRRLSQIILVNEATKITKVSKLNKILGFTLIELLVVISIISILASIILLSINPSLIFINARNSNRSSDLNTYSQAIGKYIAESSVNATARSLDDLGVGALYSTATSSNPYGNCPNGSQGQNLSTTNSFTIDNSGNPNTINTTVLINNGYLPKTLLDPQGSTYNACIDTNNNNQLIIFAGNTEGGNAIINQNIASLTTSTLPSISSGITTTSSGSTTTSYNCPTGIIYSNGSCNPTYTSSTFGTTGTNPHGIAFDSAGNLYTANTGSNTVTKITPGGVSSTFGTTGV